MFRVIDPQPQADDISFWIMIYSSYHQAWGLANPQDKRIDGEFIPLPEDIKQTGVIAVKRNNLWFWSRPAFYNLSNPKDQVFATPLGIFNKDQMRLIANCVNYQQNDPAGLDCHQVNVLVGQLYTLLVLSLAVINDPEEKQQIIEGYHLGGI